MHISGTEFAPPRVPSFNVVFREHFSNRSFCLTFGYTAALEALHHHFTGVFHVEENGFFAPAVRGVTEDYQLSVDLSDGVSTESLLRLPSSDELDDLNMKHLDPYHWGIMTRCAINSKWIYTDRICVDGETRKLYLNTIRQEWMKRQNRAVVLV
jgi:hypothetical protein